MKSEIIFFGFQRQCVEYALFAQPIKKHIPSNPWRYKAWCLINFRYFEYFMLALILFNSVCLALQVRAIKDFIKTV